MIVRKQPNGEMVLVGQTEHSRLVGQIAAHWGNDRFAAPEPFDSMARCATYHDFGWLRYEGAPIYDKEAGDTPEFRKVPPSKDQLEAYEWCYDWLLGPDPMASLIANMHRTGLWRSRYGTITYPTAFNPRALSPAVEEFIARNEARQEREAKALDKNQVMTNYRMLQVWDLLGLYFGCQEPCEDYIEPVPVTYHDSDKGIRLSMTPVGSGKVKFDPFPFDERGVHVQMSYKTVAGKFPDEASFRKAYFKAPMQVMDFELV